MFMSHVARPFIYVILSFIMWSIIGTMAASSGEAASRSRVNRPSALTVSQAVRIALNRNYKITEARLEVRKKEHERRSAFSDFFPSLKIEYTAEADRYQNIDNIEYLGLAHDSRWYVRYINGNEVMPAYPYRIDPYRSFTFTATLTQPLYSGGKLLSQYKMAKLGVDKGEIQLELDKQDLILAVHKACYQLALAYKLLETANKSVQALAQHKKESEAFFRAGLVLDVDVLSAEGRLAKAKISRRQAAKTIEVQQGKLNYLLRYAQGTPTRVAVSDKVQPATYRVPEIYEIAARNRLEIAKANISIEQALASVRASEAGLLPSVSLEVAGSRLNDDWNPFDPEAYNDWTLKGIMKWSFDMFRTRETVKKKRATHAQQFVNSQLVAEQIFQEVQEAFARLQRAEGDVPDSKTSLRAFLKNYQKNVALYREQLATYREVLRRGKRCGSS